MVVDNTSGGNGSNFQCSSAVDDGEPCQYSMRIAKMGRGKGSNPYFSFVQNQQTNPIHSPNCSSKARAIQPVIMNLPEIADKIASHLKVTAAEVHTARGEALCLNVGQKPESRERQNRRVAQHASSTSGKGASNLWGRARNYLARVVDRNPGTTYRIGYAPAVEGEPATINYIMLQFTQALECLVGEGKITLEVCAPPSILLSCLLFAQGISFLARSLQQCVPLPPSSYPVSDSLRASHSLHPRFFSDLWHRCCCLSWRQPRRRSSLPPDGRARRRQKRPPRNWCKSQLVSCPSHPSMLACEACRRCFSCWPCTRHCGHTILRVVL